MSKSKFVIDKLAKLFEQGLVSYKDLSNEILNILRSKRDEIVFKMKLTSKEEKRLEKEVSVIPAFLEQAKNNLDGNARDLWIAGIENIKDQEKDLDFIVDKISHNNFTLLQKLEAAKKIYI